MALKNYLNNASDVLLAARRIAASDGTDPARRTAARAVVRQLVPLVREAEAALPGLTRVPPEQRAAAKRAKASLRDGLQDALNRADELLELPPHMTASQLPFSRWKTPRL